MYRFGDAECEPGKGITVCTSQYRLRRSACYSISFSTFFIPTRYVCHKKMWFTSCVTIWVTVHHHWVQDVAFPLQVVAESSTRPASTVLYKNNVCNHVQGGPDLTDDIGNRKISVKKHTQYFYFLCKIPFDHPICLSQEYVIDFLRYYLSVTVHHHWAQDVAFPPPVVAGAARPPDLRRHGARSHPHAARSLHTQLQAGQQGQYNWITKWSWFHQLNEIM